MSGVPVVNWLNNGGTNKPIDVPSVVDYATTYLVRLVLVICHSQGSARRCLVARAGWDVTVAVPWVAGFR